METLVDLFLHLDTHLADVVATYGVWIYGLLFLIVFAETGLVVTPILPGDSLLFAAGALGATGVLNPMLVAVLLVLAAVIGDAVNYSVGRYVGPRVFSAERHDTIWNRLLNKDHLRQAHEFFERYGGKAVVLGRFVPIVRTFVPFVAGAGAMTYGTFVFYNIAGALLWVGVCVGAGYLFGNVPIVKNNFSIAALVIIAVSVLPMVIELLQARRRASGTTAAS